MINSIELFRNADLYVRDGIALKYRFGNIGNITDEIIKEEISKGSRVVVEIEGNTVYDFRDEQ